MIIETKSPTKVKIEAIETKTEKPKEAPQPVEQPKPKPKALGTATGSCYDAMKQVFPESQWGNATIIIKNESSGNPNNIGGPNKNGTYDYGCFQINKGLQSYGEKIFDPTFNAKIALGKWQSSGWYPWKCGECRKLW